MRQAQANQVIAAILHYYLLGVYLQLLTRRLLVRACSQKYER